MEGEGEEGEGERTGRCTVMKDKGGGEGRRQ